MQTNISSGHCRGTMTPEKDAKELRRMARAARRDAREYQELANQYEARADAYAQEMADATKG